MRNITLLAISILISTNFSNAQNCEFDSVHERLMLTNQEYANRHKASEERIHEAVWETGNRSAAVRVIPTVVHVVHRSGIAVGTDENLTDSEIINEINQANDRFRHNSQLTFSNPYSGVDIEIQLCLASQDPNGAATTGIVRHASDANTINNMDNQNTQLAYNWPTTDYLNLYVVNTICDDASPCPTANSVAGYAYFPSSHGQPYDGGVFRYGAFWDGLLAHELGHYFGLYHVFQGSGSCTNDDCTTDGDRICDTPPKEACCTGPGGCSNTDNTCNTDEDDTSTNNPFRATNLGGMGDQPESMENYMDFTASCWEAYTQGQKERMIAAVDVERASLLSSNGCGPTGINDIRNGSFYSSISPNPTAGNVTLELSSNTSGKMNYSVHNLYGQLVMQGTFQVQKGDNRLKLDISKLANATYGLTIELEGQQRIEKVTKVDTF